MREYWPVPEAVLPLWESLLTGCSLGSGIILSTRLKALGVESVIVDKHPQPGDNWALRYDCLRFHIGRGNAETPYLSRFPSLARSPCSH